MSLFFSLLLSNLGMQNRSISDSAVSHTPVMFASEPSFKILDCTCYLALGDIRMTKSCRANADKAGLVPSLFR